MLVDLTAAEIDLIDKGLDAYAYWELSEDHYRKNGEVMEPGNDDEDMAAQIVECRQFQARVCAATATPPVVELTADDVNLIKNALDAYAEEEARQHGYDPSGDEEGDGDEKIGQCQEVENKLTALGQGIVAIGLAMTAPEPVWWVVTMRQCGDDEDSLYVVQGANWEAAQAAALAAYLEEDASTKSTEGDPDADKPEYFVNHIVRVSPGAKPEHVASVHF